MMMHSKIAGPAASESMIQCKLEKKYKRTLEAYSCSSVVRSGARQYAVS